MLVNTELCKSLVNPDKVVLKKGLQTFLNGRGFDFGLQLRKPIKFWHKHQDFPLIYQSNANIQFNLIVAEPKS